MLLILQIAIGTAIGIFIGGFAIKFVWSACSDAAEDASVRIAVFVLTILVFIGLIGFWYHLSP